MSGRAAGTIVAAAVAALAVPATAVAHADHCLEPPEPRLEGPQLRLTKIVTIGEVTGIEHAPGEHGRLYVAERAGRVSVIEGGRARPFLDRSAAILPTVDWEFNERGMQSLAFARDYRRSRRFYVFYNDADGDTVVDEYRATPDFRQADPGTRRRLLFVRHSFSDKHYGGQLATSGRRLYVALGDATRPHSAQRRGLYGRIVSLDPRRPRRSRRTVAKGLRNPFHFSFDSFTRKLVVADVGDTRSEEIDVLPRRRFGRANFGWPYLEGRSRRRRGTPKHYIPPVLTYGHRVGSAVIGGRTIRDPRLPRLRGRYLFGDLCHGWLALARLHRKPATSRRTGLAVSYPTAFGEDAARRLHVAAASGEIYRVDPAR